MAGETVLALTNVRRTFKQAGTKLEVLRGVNLDIHAGEIVALLGPSGSGKSTMLQIAGLLEAPDEGDVIVGGTSTRGLGDQGRTQIRRKGLGFVYQFHFLLPEFSALENVMLPQMVAKRSRGAAKARATALLESMGLGHRLEHRPARLSGGEQQRTAIARALANEPLVLLADEPTGNLDPGTAAQILALLRGQLRANGGAGILITHSRTAAESADHILELDGRSLAPQPPRDRAAPGAG